MDDSITPTSLNKAYYFNVFSIFRHRIQSGGWLSSILYLCSELLWIKYVCLLSSEGVIILHLAPWSAYTEAVSVQPVQGSPNLLTILCCFSVSLPRLDCPDPAHLHTVHSDSREILGSSLSQTFLPLSTRYSCVASSELFSLQDILEIFLSLEGNVL